MVENGINRLSNPTLWAEEMVKSTFDLDEALRLLGEDFPIRRIDEVLGNAIRQSAQKLEKTEAAARATLVEKLGPQNVSNWLRPGTNARIDREKAIGIAFALQMTYEEAEEFLKKCWLDGFYMRDVKDVIYRYCLKHGKDYDFATEMAESFAGLNDSDLSNPDPVGSGSRQVRITIWLSDLTSAALSEEELGKIIWQNEQFFGSFRRGAYERFVELYNGLKQDQKEDAEKRYSIEEEDKDIFKISDEDICSMIVKGIPKIKGRGPNEVIRNCIAKYIPGRTGISEIINKAERDGKIVEVDRKLFMLAWLASKDGEVDDYLLSDDADVDFREYISVLNSLLATYGMAELDARHPFDWILMNSIRCGFIPDEKNEWIEDIEERMRALIEKMKV